MRSFDKPAKTFDEQIGLLKERGMQIQDAELASHYLAHLNYYRLAGYWLFFENGGKNHRFRSDTTFECVLNLYVFDRELRLLILDAIERIEVSIRTQWAYHMAHNHGPHAYLDPELAKNRDYFEKNVSRLRDEIERSKEAFILHYKNTYNLPESPPIWAVCEIISLGTLSAMLSNLKPSDLRRKVTANYHLDDKVFCSFFHHLTVIRNRCAHHCRLWNSQFTVTVSLPRNKPVGLRQNFNLGEERKLYNTLVLMKWCLDVISPDHQWHERLIALLEKHRVETHHMGFPDNYRSLPIWG